jgi:hypothetical protein
MKNIFDVRGEVTAIIIVHKNSTMECLIDTSDLHIIQYGSWNADWNSGTKSFYARGPHPLKPGKKIRMHQLLCSTTTERPFVDHENHNTLDNRRRNLAARSRSENGINRKGAQSNHRNGARGAYFFEHLRKWQARVKFRGTCYYFGNHETSELAALAANAGRMRLLSGERVTKSPYNGRAPQVGDLEANGRI